MTNDISRPPSGSIASTVGSSAPGRSNPASTRDGEPAPDASMARSNLSFGASASMATLVSHAVFGTHSIPRSERRSARSASDARRRVVERQPVEPVGHGQQRRRAVGQQIDIRLHDLLAGLAQAEDAQRHPRVVGRDGDVHRGPVPDLLAPFGGRVRIERRGEEDLAARRVELEHLGRIRREAEPMVGRPAADLVGAATQDRDVQRVDGDLHEDLGLTGGGPHGIGREEARLRLRVGLEPQPLERPVTALLDAGRYPGEWRQAPEGSATARELERGDVVLLAVVIPGERRRSQEIDRPIGADQPAAG